MTLHSNIKAMEAVLSDLQAQRDEALSSYVGLSADCSNLETLIDSIRARRRPAASESLREPIAEGPPKQLALAEEPEPAERPIPTNEASVTGYPTDVDVSGVGSHLDRIRLLAERLPDQTFRVTDAAQWLIDMGASNASPDSLTSALYGKFKAMPDFRKTQPGYFQFVGYGESAEIIPFGVTAAD